MTERLFKLWLVLKFTKLKPPFALFQELNSTIQTGLIFIGKQIRNLVTLDFNLGVAYAICRLRLYPPNCWVIP